MSRFHEVRARRFVLEDAHGRERATLSTEEGTGVTSMTMVGDDGITTVDLSTLPGGAALTLRDEFDNERVMISVRHGSAFITINDLGGNPAVAATVGPGAERTIGLFLDGSTVAWGKRANAQEDEAVDDL